MTSRRTSDSSRPARWIMPPVPLLPLGCLTLYRTTSHPTTILPPSTPHPGHRVVAGTRSAPARVPGPPNEKALLSLAAFVVALAGRSRVLLGQRGLGVAGLDALELFLEVRLLRIEFDDLL